MNVKRFLVVGVVVTAVVGLAAGFNSPSIYAQVKETAKSTDKSALNKTKVKLEKDVSDEGPSLGKLVGGETENNENNPSGGTYQYTVESMTWGLVGAGSDKTSAKNESAASTLTYLIGGMYASPPAGTSTYVAYLLKSAHIVQPAYAQGLGFAALSPILDAWIIFRNLAYLFFILLFLTIGFAIMFRRKLGGQTAITAQQAIPRIIMALVFVTFSYAIAGFLIDLMYIFMFLLLVVFDKLGNQSEFIGSNFVQLGKLMVTTGFNLANEAVSDFVEKVVDVDVVGDIAGFITGVTAGFIVALIIVLNLFKLFIELLKTYISILISIVLSPILLMFGAIPGKNPFGGWIKSLVGNLAAFPTVLFVLIIVDEIVGIISGVDPASFGDSGEGFMPPYLIGSGTGSAVQFLIGLGALIVMPELVKEAKKLMGASGGVFDQFSTALVDSAKRGWSGGEIIPGWGLTNTNTLFGAGRIGGVNAKNILQKQAVGVGGIVGGVGGAYGQMFAERGAAGSAARGIGRGAVAGAKWVARRATDPNLKKWAESNNQGKNPPTGVGQNKPNP